MAYARGGFSHEVGAEARPTPGPLTDLGVRISPLAPALPEMSGLAHSSRLADLTFRGARRGNLTFLPDF